MVNAGEFLQPDDVTFSVLMRGYGEMNPPSWVLISGLLKMMDKKFSMKPSLGTTLLLSPARCSVQLHSQVMLQGSLVIAANCEFATAPRCMHFLNMLLYIVPELQLRKA